MKIKYDSDADILIFIIRDDPPNDAIEEPGGVIVSYRGIARLESCRV